MSTREAARALGVTYTHVLNLVWDGRLQATKMDKTWRIAVSAIEGRKRALEEREKNQYKGAK